MITINHQSGEFVINENSIVGFNTHYKKNNYDAYSHITIFTVNSSVDLYLLDEEIKSCAEMLGRLLVDK